MEDLDKIKNIIIELLQYLDYESEIDVVTQEKTIYVNIHVDEPALLIGKRGKHLVSLQHLSRLLVTKKLDRPVNLVIDIADFRRKQKEYLIQESLKIADIVRSTGQIKPLRPMNSYERRIVHLTLKDEQGVTSESEGEGVERKVIVKVTKE